MSAERSDEIETEAIRWVWRLDREDRTPALQAELDRWLAGDRRRRGALLQAEAAWSLLDAGRRTPVECNAEEAELFRRTVDPLAQSRTEQRRRITRRNLIVGGAAVAASAAALVWMQEPGGRYRTTVGELRSVPLADGSTAAINTLSTLTVDLGPTLRRVDVAEGEVWFHVAKDPARPFIVGIGAVRVRAVGTAFSVRRRDTGVDVLVTEGTVATWIEGSDRPAVKVSEGTKAFVAVANGVSTTMDASAQIDRALAWRAGEIDLSGETLADAAEEFNRYNVRKLAIYGDKLAQERFFGVFRTDDPEGFARAVRQSLGAQVIATPSSIHIAP